MRPPPKIIFIYLLATKRSSRNKPSLTRDSSNVRLEKETPYAHILSSLDWKTGCDHANSHAADIKQNVEPGWPRTKETTARCHVHYIVYTNTRTNIFEYIHTSVECR